MNDIQIDFYFTDSDDPAFTVYWPAVPSTGDIVTVEAGSGIVECVSWGTHVDGNGNVLPNSPAVVVELKRKAEEV